jgi:hypothetical protein
MKICPLGAEFHAVGRTNRQRDMKLTVTFLSFAKAPKNNLLQIQEMLNKICRWETWITACFSGYVRHEEKARGIYRSAAIKISKKIYKHLT